jgi:hypothetical protein
MRHPPLDEPERNQQQPRDNSDVRCSRECPAVARRALDAEHERSQARDGGKGARQVQLAKPPAGRGRSLPRSTSAATIAPTPIETVHPKIICQPASTAVYAPD